MFDIGAQSFKCGWNFIASIEFRVRSASIHSELAESLYVDLK